MPLNLPHALYLQQLQLTQFKSYTTAHLTCSPALNCIVGPNGKGKTNLLDAIHYLCLCKSHFSLPDALLVQQGTDFFRLDSTWCLSEGYTERLVCKVAPRRTKVFELNQVAYTRLADHLGRYPLVMIAPDDAALAVGASEERRLLLDQTLSQTDPVYVQQLMLYNRLIDQRNTLLKTFHDQHRWDEDLLRTYDSQLLAPAQYIYQSRQALVNWLQPLYQHYYEHIAVGAEQASLLYQSALAQHSMAELLAEARPRDAALQRTTVGPHRDDLELNLRQLPVKRFASQGQIKSCVLALRLSQHQYIAKATGKKPLLLLDDLFDKLDEQRARQLIQLLHETQLAGQVFITDTHPDRTLRLAAHAGSEYAIFKVPYTGHIQPMP